MWKISGDVASLCWDHGMPDQPASWLVPSAEEFLSSFKQQQTKDFLKKAINIFFYSNIWALLWWAQLYCELVCPEGRLQASASLCSVICAETDNADVRGWNCQPIWTPTAVDRLPKQLSSHV